MKTKLFFISLLAILSLASCSNFVESLQKNKPTGVEQQGQQNGQDQSQKPQVQPEVLYNITFADFENGGISSSKTTGIKAGEEIILSVEAETGYVFKSLTVYNAQNKDVAVAQIVAGSSFKFTMPNSDVTVKVVFEAKPQNQQTGTEEQTQQTGTEQQNQQTTPDDTTTQPPAPTGPVRYRVEHYQQDVDGSDTYELYAIQEKRGEAGSDTAASAKNYPGFTAVDFEQPKIAADGSTIVRIYYNRNTITYIFDPNGGNWDGSTDVVEVSGLFEGEVVVPQNPVRMGYTFNVWDKTIPQLFGSENQTITAGWNANDDTPYNINFYVQKIEGGNNYDLESTTVLYGTTDTTTSYEAYERIGFDVDVQQTNIEPDGSGILNVYWNRKSYTVTFDTKGGNPMESQQILYQASPLQIPLKDGYTFYNWYKDSDCSICFDSDEGITDNITLYAFWRDNSITYRFHETVDILPASETGTFGTEGEYVLFGDYPQSLKESSITVDENKIMRMGDWIVYGGSDGNLYYKYDDGKYFKIEPIKWRVISRDENNIVVLLAENILDISFYSNRKYTVTYTYSFIRNFLINDFASKVFTVSAQNLIKLTTIDSDASEYGNYLDLYSDDTVYLLKYSELFDSCVFRYDLDRMRPSTMFAANKALELNLSSDVSSVWWLRTCYNILVAEGDDLTYREGRVEVLLENGNHDLRICDKYGGVVPAISVYLPPAE